jgi:hypothetical protein
MEDEQRIRFGSPFAFALVFTLVLSFRVPFDHYAYAVNAFKPFTACAIRQATPRLFSRRGRLFGTVIGCVWTSGTTDENAEGRRTDDKSENSSA